ncbi:hypothetical protein PINS_up000560 [Pythium insidiosum]|nr:hypothetical protein PINS_up000560 [Pythium insidiosum]
MRQLRFVAFAVAHSTATATFMGESTMARNPGGHRGDGAMIPSQQGRVAVVTGGNSGIGFCVARELAAHGAHTILACRNEAQARDACKRIRSELKGVAAAGDVLVISMDLGRLATVKAFSEDFHKRFDRLDLLVNNAGVGMPSETKSPDGYSIQFSVNFLGHFYLTTLLFDLLKAAKSARVVNVSSLLHNRHSDYLLFRPLKLNFDELPSGVGDNALGRYEKSKLCNLLFTLELQRRLESAELDHKMLSVAAHPGVTATEIFQRAFEANFPSFLQGILEKAVFAFFQTAEKGALPILYAATARQVRGGEYYGPDGFFHWFGYPERQTMSPQAQSQDDARQLWELAERLTETPFCVG